MSVTVVQNESLPFTRVFRTSVIFCRKSLCVCELLKRRAEVKKYFHCLQVWFGINLSRLIINISNHELVFQRV